MDQIEQALSENFNLLINARLAHIRNPDEDTQEQLEAAQQTFDQIRALREEMANLAPAVIAPVPNFLHNGNEEDEQQENNLIEEDPVDQQEAQNEDFELLGPMNRNAPKIRAKLPKFNGVYLKEPKIFLRIFAQTIKLNGIPGCQLH